MPERKRFFFNWPLPLGDDSSLTLKLTASSPCDLVRVSGKGGVMETNQENFWHVFGDYRSGCFLLFVFRDHLVDCPTQLTLVTWICQLRRRWGPFIRGCKMFGRKDIWGQYFCKMYMVCLDKAPRLSISIVIWILSSDTETSAATPLGGGARKVLAK